VACFVLFPIYSLFSSPNAGNKQFNRISNMGRAFSTRPLCVVSPRPYTCTWTSLESQLPWAGATRWEHWVRWLRHCSVQYKAQVKHVCVADSTSNQYIQSGQESSRQSKYGSSHL
jgi:hypothetical protein